MSELVVVQPAEQSHLNFIKSTWLKSFFSTRPPLCENMTSDVYYQNHSRLIDEILPHCTALVAQSKETPEVTVGYIVFEKTPPIVHYAYVRGAFWRFGVGKTLLEATGFNGDDFSYTHRNKQCAWIFGFSKRVDPSNGKFGRVFIEGKLPKATYNPYLFMNRGLCGR